MTLIKMLLLVALYFNFLHIQLAHFKNILQCQEHKEKTDTETE